MDKIVKHSRIGCSAKCILNFDGIDYRGVIENISLSGALIKMDNVVLDIINAGDKCNITICSDQDVYPVKYTCKVIRLDMAFIGVEFIELNTM